MVTIKGVYYKKQKVHLFLLFSLVFTALLNLFFLCTILEDLMFQLACILCKLGHEGQACGLLVKKPVMRHIFHITIPEFNSCNKSWLKYLVSCYHVRKLHWVPSSGLCCGMWSVNERMGALCISALLKTNTNMLLVEYLWYMSIMKLQLQILLAFVNIPWFEIILEVIL